MRRFKKLIIAIASCVVIWIPTTQNVRAAVDISDLPLFLGGVIEPNIMFTLDDSGSMQWEAMPSSALLNGGGYAFYYLFPFNQAQYGGTWYGYSSGSVDLPGYEDDNEYSYRMRSSHNNVIYYDPDISYHPWSYPDGTLYPDASPACAYHNPYDTSLGCRNLTVINDGGSGTSTGSYGWWYQRKSDGSYDWSQSNYVNPQTSDAGFWPGTYFNWTPGGSGCAVSDISDRDCYTKVEIKSTVSSYSSPDGITRTYDEEIQNFANWYSYYRSRILLARAGVGRAFANQGTAMRVGFAAINEGSNTIDGESHDNTLIRGVREFEDDGVNNYRSNIFDLLYGHVINSNYTPLRQALNQVGEYYERDDNGGPWREKPASTAAATTELTCRQAYNVLMTDGYWNGPAPLLPSGVDNNVDDNDGPSLTGPDNDPFKYEPENPYKDDWDNTLADYAMYYWYRDLRTDLDNEVPTNVFDDAYWQHMVSFTVGLGVEGTVSQADLDALTPTSSPVWPQPSTWGSVNNVDDLFHAAVNSRGAFFSASNPLEFASALQDTLSDIVGRTSSAAAIATNSTRLDSDTFVYQARFDSTDWLGQLRAFKVSQVSGEVLESDPDNWEASEMLDNRSSALPRNIFTYDSAAGDGVVFNWSNLPAAHKNYLVNSGTDAEGEDRLDYLQGERDEEQKNGGVLRDRTSILGDIINSDPFFVGKQDYGYNALPGTEGSSYSAYRLSSRPGVVYVGANDGMLHAFLAEETSDSDTTLGDELFAFIPEAVFPNLALLTSPTYSHRYFVDGPPRAGDAYINSAWTTVLVGTTGAGGKSVFALDVSDPENFSVGDVMWEFTDTTDSDLGYTIGQASVVRMANGDWAAVFGNGFDSSTGKAVLYVVDITDGSLIARFDTGVGSASDPNGMATPVTVDINNDRIIDYIYAGDMQGNLWGFDVTDTNANKWASRYKSGNSPAPVFKAFYDKDKDGVFDAGDDNVQPITSKPDAMKHPNGGVIVVFGTGKYFETYDSISDDKMSFYGIWDDTDDNQFDPAEDRDELVEQTIDYEVNQTYTNPDNPSDTYTLDLRVTSEHDVDTTVKKGWFMDLRQPDPDFNTSGTHSSVTWQGERVVSAPLLREGRVIFATLIPSLDPCEFGGTGWLMELNAVDGKRLPVTPFDLNNDGVFDSRDYVSVDHDGDANTPAILIPASGKKSKEGIIKTPGIVKTEAKEFKYVSGSSGDIEMTVESRSARTGRQSWRQLQ
ncbi:pilus assembly protein [Solemya velesiana gill symbiont]|uniref:pilus assembly protein n=1 Tax=Solemya velesiana gill symbiont TaxID=1918948 RepID=UPI0015611C9F|nr:PilC/PilY family type IV pilus protein [Solemya velesiana gill symbiont]